MRREACGANPKIEGCWRQVKCLPGPCHEEDHNTAGSTRSRLGEMRALICRRTPCHALRWAAPTYLTPPPGALLASPDPGFVCEVYPPPSPLPPLPTPRPLQLELELEVELELERPAARGSQAPPARLGPLWKGLPAADLSLPRRPRAEPGLGARERAAGAWPGYLQEESFGFGSPLLGPIQLTLPLPAAEKRRRLERAPSRAPLRALLPSSPASPRGAPAQPRPAAPASFLNSLLLEGSNEPRVQDVLLGLPSAVPAESHMHKIKMKT